MFCEGNHIIFIGAQKAGTTWFQHVLGSDSRASTSVAQEVNYLNREGRLEFDEYCSYFSNGSGASASVDVTPAYLTSTRVLPTLKAFYNEYNFKPKIVVCLR
jgi:EAL domain-containing protein (putative c-di-GMP-specific phosphodiesterase class I)